MSERPSYYVYPVLNETLKGYVKDSHEVIIEKGIIEKLCTRYGVDLSDLKGKSRKREIVFVRHLAMFLLKRKTTRTLGEIGSVFGLDHTATIYAIRSINNYLETNCFNKRDEILSFL
jgi:chromosomal replication initiator protein